MRGALVLVLLVALLVGACNSSGGDSAPGDTGDVQAANAPADNATAPAAREPNAAEPNAASQPEARTDRAGEAGDDPDAEAEAAVAVVRAWSTALNAGENEAAAELFAPDAIVIQGPNTLPLADMDAAVLFNASLPCSGLIVDVTVNDNVVTAVFELGNRLSSTCDAPPGTLAAADFLIEDGNILAWQLVPLPDQNDGSSATT